MAAGVEALIFGISAITAALTNSEAYGPSLLILGALSLAAVELAPIAAGAALRFQLK